MSEIQRQLRAWQREALELWLKRRSGVASVVTGAGKTTFALECISQIRDLEPGLQVLIVVPTLALLDQWLVELEAGLGLTTADVATHGGGKTGPSKAAVHVAVVNTARSQTATLTKSGRWMLVADECHRYGAPANRAAITGDWVAALGLSATPVREYDDYFERFVAPETGGVFYEYSYEDALRDGVLTPFSLSNYQVALASDERDQVERADRSIARLLSQGADPDALNKALFRRARIIQSARARLPTARELMRRHRGVRALVFHEQIPAAERLVKMLSADGHRVVAYHSGISMPRRQKNLLMFRTHQADILVTCRALDEGLDVPDAEYGVICASTASSRQRIQRLGRLLRKSDGKASAEVATLYADEREEERLRAEANALEGLAGVRWYKAVSS